MSVILILKKVVPALLRRMDRPFKVSVNKQKELLESFPEPKDNIERSFLQYKCQSLFWGKPFYFFASVAACILLPIQILSFKRKPNPAAEPPVDLLLLSQDMPDHIFPEELLDEFPNRVRCSMLDGYAMLENDWAYFSRLRKRYPRSPFFLYKCLVKLAMYSYQIQKYHPRVIATCGGEFTFTSSLLTDYCEWHEMEHYNTMHGEMFYYVLDSFCSFHRFYIWDTHYRDLLCDLRADSDAFIIAPPKAVHIDFKTVDTEGLEIYDFKYYLQLQDALHMRRIAAALNKLKEKGCSVCVRYHPRTPNLDTIVKAFPGIDIEHPGQVKIEQSIKTARTVIALNSTVLYQAYISGIRIAVDDVTDEAKYKLLREMRYIILSKQHILLSKLIHEEEKMRGQAQTQEDAAS